MSDSDDEGGIGWDSSTKDDDKDEKEDELMWQKEKEEKEKRLALEYEREQKEIELRKKKAKFRGSLRRRMKGYVKTKETEKNEKVSEVITDTPKKEFDEKKKIVEENSKSPEVTVKRRVKYRGSLKRRMKALKARKKKNGIE